MNLLQDLRFALRQLRHAPGFAFTAILILTLGIAANVIGFGVLQGSAQDPLVLAAVALTILVTGFLSVASPVRRALHVDPARLLREE